MKLFQFQSRISFSYYYDGRALPRLRLFPASAPLREAVACSQPERERDTDLSTITKQKQQKTEEIIQLQVSNQDFHSFYCILMKNEFDQNSKILTVTNIFLEIHRDSEN